jgi:hypothetical protein
MVRGDDKVWLGLARLCSDAESLPPGAGNAEAESGGRHALVAVDHRHEVQPVSALPRPPVSGDLVTTGQSEAGQKRQGLDGLSRGWAVGTHGWRQAIAKDHAHLSMAGGLERESAKALNEASWHTRLPELLTDCSVDVCLQAGPRRTASRHRRRPGAPSAESLRAARPKAPAQALSNAHSPSS